MTTTAAVSTPPARRIPCPVLGTGFDEAECRWFMVFEADGTGERLCLREPRGTALLDRARWVLGLGPGDGPGRGRRGAALRTLGAAAEAPGGTTDWGDGTPAA